MVVFGFEYFVLKLDLEPRCAATDDINIWNRMAIEFLQLDVLQITQIFTRIKANFQGILKIPNISDLARNCDTFAVVCSHSSVVIECLLSLVVQTRIQEIAADHQTSSALTGLTMNSCNIFRMFCEPDTLS